MSILDALQLFVIDSGTHFHKHVKDGGLGAYVVADRLPCNATNTSTAFI